MLTHVNVYRYIVGVVGVTLCLLFIVNTAYSGGSPWWIHVRQIMYRGEYTFFLREGSQGGCVFMGGVYNRCG